MAELIEQGILLLHDWGFFTIFLPFLLFYVIIYAMLEKIELFGENKNNYNAIFSFSISFLSVYKLDVGENLPFLISRATFLMIIFVIVMIISGMTGSDSKHSTKIIIPLIILYLVYSVVDAFFNIKDIYSWAISKLPLNIIIPAFIAIIVFTGIIWFMTKPEESSNSSNNNNNNNENEKGHSNENSDRLNDTQVKGIDPETKKKWDSATNMNEAMESIGEIDKP